MTTYERRRYGVRRATPDGYLENDLTCQHCGMLPSVHKRGTTADGAWDGRLICLTDEEVLADLQQWQRDGRVSLEGRGPVDSVDNSERRG